MGEAYLCSLVRRNDWVREASGHATLLVRHMQCVRDD